MKSELPKKLPASSEFGSYWLGRSPTCPAIFKCTKVEERWFASLGDLTEDFGILTDEGGIMRFTSPLDAFKELHRRLVTLPLSFRGGL